MRFKPRESFAEKEARLGKWRKWFAWRPVRLPDRSICWLEFVYRRAASCVVDDFLNDLPVAIWVWEYKEAATAESDAIVNEKPIYNVHQNQGGIEYEVD